MTEKEKIIVTGYTGVTMVSFGLFHEDVEKRLGRPVFTHEFIEMEAELKELYKEDFIKLCEGVFTSKDGFLDVRDFKSRNLKHAYSGVNLISDDGEEFGICNRDSGFEFQYSNIWYEAKCGEIKKLCK